MNISIFVKVVISYSVLLVLLFLIGMYNFFELDNAIQNYDNLFNASKIVDEVRTMQVDFKKQVQEWKNMLIRGHVPEDFDKYYSQFVGQYNKVLDGGKKITNSKFLTPDNIKILKEFLRSHKLLQEQYLNALKIFYASGNTDCKSTDRLVRGKDRPPTDLLDKLTTSILNQTNNAKNKIQETANQTKIYTITIWIITLIIVYILSIYLAYKIAQLYGKQENLSKNLSKYLSPQIYNSIFSGNRKVKVEAYRKNITIFFSDINGFTQLTDSIESETLSSLLNEYFNEMSNIALDYGGTLDKFIGDAIMIFFGDPETKGEKEDALACIFMAIEMRNRMKVLKQKWELVGIYKPLQVRIGINSGFCTVGNFGSEKRMDYTIIGGPVNLASRLESKANSDEILISHQTYALVKDEIYCEKRNKIHVKGFSYPVQTYHVIDVHEKVDNEQLKLQSELGKFLDKINPTELSDSVRFQIGKLLKDKRKKLLVEVDKNPT